MRNGLRVLFVGLALAVAPAAALGEPTDRSFTYQGQLKKAGLPLNGTADVVFTLWDAAAGGSQVGLTLSVPGASLLQGLFTVDLDFGASAFNGEGRWLEIQVRNPAGAGAYTTLAPRQPILPTPYALFALNGNPGPTGPTGAAGPTGALGPTGSQGPTGIQGPQGVAGPTGAQGLQGNTGGAGPTGVAGPTGTAGGTGPAGPTGAQGPTGVGGPDIAVIAANQSGMAMASVPTPIVFPLETFNSGGAAMHSPAFPHRFFATTTGRYEVHISAAWSGHGGSGTRRLDLRVNGATSINGTLVTCSGVTGGNNVVGNASWIVNLNVGDFVEVMTAAPSGTVGTLAAADASFALLGAGPQGVTGATGSTGPTGVVGPTGAGVAGPTGPQGVAGATGATGPAGPTGAGVAGGTGPTGPQGLDGLGVLPSGLMVLSESPTPPAQFTYVGAARAIGVGWRRVSNMARSETGHACVELGGKVYSIGGQVQGGVTDSNTQVFDPALGYWTSLALLTPTRYDHTAVASGDFIYVVGGRQTGGVPTPVVSVYVTSLGSWTTGPPFPDTRSNPAGTAADGVVYVIGGTGAIAGPILALSGGSWSARATPPFSASDVVTAATVGGKIYCTTSGGGMFEYTPLNNTWAVKAVGLARGSSHAGASVGSRIFVFGGYEVASGLPSDILSVFDTASNTWTESTILVPEWHAGSVGVSLGSWIYAVGGLQGVTEIPHRVDRLDVTQPLALHLHRKH